MIVLYTNDSLVCPALAALRQASFTNQGGFKEMLWCQSICS